MTPRTKYEFQVIGENEFGDGMYSAIIEAQTKGKYIDNKKNVKRQFHIPYQYWSQSTFCQEITPPLQLLVLKSVQFEWCFGRKWSSILIWYLKLSLPFQYTIGWNNFWRTILYFHAPAWKKNVNSELFLTNCAVYYDYCYFKIY